MRAVAQGPALEFAAIGVGDGVSHRGNRNEFMPLIYRELTGVDRGPLAVIDDPPEIPIGPSSDGGTLPRC